MRRKLPLLVGILFTFAVLVLAGCGGGGDSIPSVSSTPITAPSGINTTSGNGQVTISWNPVTGATSYNIYKATASGVTKSNYSSLADGMKHAGIVTPYYSFTGLTNGTGYYFVVTAVDAGGESSGSDQVLALPQVSSFSATGAMAAARISHTTTLLSNGKVLVAGGIIGGSTPLPATAEIYDPTTASFTSTGSMVTARYGHVATLLSNGKVLITGGQTVTQILNSAEIYDPATGLFTSTGNMIAATGASGHYLVTNDATLLPNGKVLVIGTDYYAVKNFSVQIYDPITALFTSINSLAAATYASTATVLSNGTVLVTGITGGASVPAYAGVAGIYDPITGSFATTGSMELQARNAIPLSNGKVLLIGNDVTGTFAMSALYEPATAKFTSTGSMAARVSSYTATLLSNGRVLVAGGRESSSGDVMLASAEIYDPVLGTYSATGNMTIIRYDAKAVLLPNGAVLVVGGATGVSSTVANATSSAELYR